ncbi:MAG TPA: guanylate kinase [Ruminococcaceae bacterium]|nr:guanylate kinase [Oscillospiraceae bacterium]
MSENGLLVILSGPSGTGKGTVLKKVLSSRKNTMLSVSATTRKPRDGEKDGADYYFMTREKFLRIKEDGGMLESAEYCGNFYGTPLAPIKDWTSKGVDVVLEIDVQGGFQVKNKVKDSVGIFILPPSMEALGHRLRKRGTEEESAVQSRLSAARLEIAKAVSYDYVVVNDEIEKASDMVCRIMDAEKLRAARNEHLIERVLKND